MSISSSPADLLRQLQARLGPVVLPSALQEALSSLSEADRRAFAMALQGTPPQQGLEAFQDLYDLLPLGLCTVDEQLTLHRFNPAIAQLCGLNSENLGVASIADYVDPGSLDFINRVLPSIMQENGPATSFDGRLRTADGQLLPVRISLAWLHHSSHDPVRILVILEDISQIMNQSELLSKLMDATPVGLCMTNSSGYIHLCQPCVSPFVWLSSGGPHRQALYDGRP